MDIAEKIRGFVKQNFYAAETSDFTDDASLLDLGIVDSTGILELVGFLESEFGISINDEEIVPENLDSVQNAAKFVTSKGEA